MLCQVICRLSLALLGEIFVKNVFSSNLAFLANSMFKLVYMPSVTSYNGPNVSGRMCQDIKQYTFHKFETFSM